MAVDAEDVAAELIARIRRARGYSQTELARRSGLDRSALSAYEHGRRQPSVATLARIAAAAGMQLDLAAAPNAAAEEHTGRILAQVLELAEALPYRPRDELAYPPLIQLRA
ncbi:MAG TPA: helix-turn-helix transcriptional regulator [Solirubrobacteraceae bacterium]|nr:helix-turn-helix transcriptional regulator [Solirubrobacteraceae bacterium]